MTAPRFDRDRPASGPVVQGFSERGFVVDGESHAAVLLTPERGTRWQAPRLADLTPEDLAEIVALDPPPEFLILGTGAAMAFAPRSLVQALEARSIGVEAMDSRAAARTWGVLRAEGRWIAAALMPL
ncbi:MAG TPA: Mth938-like domain-containing protein [Allosphingosinicella sp.]|nr:Mth938-like domain-containing protein [Allosphingosinicella sp.]